MRTEVRRGRKFVEYTDDSLPKGTFVQDISGADVSYQDEAGKWNPLDEGWETDGKDGFSFRASRMNHKVRFDSIGAWRWYPRRNVDTEYIVINRPECWLPATNRFGNLLVNNISRDGKDITLTSLRNVTRVIHSRWNGIKTDWILENDKAPTRFKQKIDLVGITEKDGVLYGKDGTELARLMPTTATDANGKELPCEGKYADGYLDFSVDTSGAAYPVTLDPDFAGDTADGYIYGLSATYSSARSTSSVIDNTKVYFVVGQFYSSYYYVNRGFLKFDTSSIPDSATVTQANLKLVCTGDASPTDFDVQIVKQNWSSQDPLSDDNRETAYDNCLSGTADNSIWRNTSGMSTNTQYASGNLDTSWVNKTGSTYYSLRSSRDKNNKTPTGNEYINIASADHTTSSYRPVLTVTYSTAYTLTCAAGSYALTGTAVTLTYTPAAQNYVLSCGAGSYALTGTAAGFVLQRNFTLSLASGSYSLTGTNANFVLQRNYTLACGAGSYALAGSACTFTVLRNYTASLSSGSYELTGTPINFVITRAYALTCEAGNYALTGTDAVITSQYVIPLGSGSYSLTGTDAIITRGYTLTADAGNYELIGTNANLTRGYTILLNSGNYAVTGTNALFEVQRNYVLPLDSSSYVLTGTNTTFVLRRNYTATLDAGPYLFTGTDANLYVQRNFAILLDAGSYVLTGTPASFSEGGKIVCEAGSYSLTGTDCNLTRGYELSLDAGSYTTTGSDINFEVQRNYAVILDAGSYAIMGTDAMFVVQRNYALIIDAGSYSFAGTDATFLIQHNFAISLDAGTYTLTGTEATFVLQRNYVLSLSSGSYVLTGTDTAFILQRNYLLSLTAGSYVLTGTPIAITFARTLALGTGSYSLTGTNAGLFRGLVLPCAAGSYLLTGSNIAINAAYTFALDVGSYLLVGTPCGLFIITATPPCRTHTIPYEDRTLEVTCH